MTPEEEALARRIRELATLISDSIVICQHRLIYVMLDLAQDSIPELSNRNSEERAREIASRVKALEAAAAALREHHASLQRVVLEARALVEGRRKGDAS